MIHKLKDASKLGFRVLGSLRVHCEVPSCEWIGDLSDLDSHLTNSDTHRDTISEFKELGNERFAAGRYEEALKLYSKALGNPEAGDHVKALLHGNSAAALLRLGRYQKAADSCQQAVALGNREAKIYVRWSQALTQAGRFTEATQVLNREEAPQSLLISQKGRSEQIVRTWGELEQAIHEENFNKAKGLVSDLLQDQWARNSTKVVCSAALIEAHVGSVDIALKLSLDACRSSPEDDKAWTARAHALLSNGQFDEARRAVRQALRLNPDEPQSMETNRRIKSVENQVQQCRDLASKKEWDEAKMIFDELITGTGLPKTSPLRVQLLAERSHVNFSAGLYEEGLKDADQAIYQKDDCQRAWLTRLYCLRKLHRFEEAMKDARSLLERWGSGDPLIRNAAEKVEFEFRKSKRVDLYQVVGVSELASEMEIKQAYKQKALFLHPDKISPNASEVERKRTEESFKLLGTALEVLGDPEKRKIYDEGYDLEGVKEELSKRKRRGH